MFVKITEMLPVNLFDWDLRVHILTLLGSMEIICLLSVCKLRSFKSSKSDLLGRKPCRLFRKSNLQHHKWCDSAKDFRSKRTHLGNFLHQRKWGFTVQSNLYTTTTLRTQNSGCCWQMVVVLRSFMYSQSPISDFLLLENGV